MTAAQIGRECVAHRRSTRPPPAAGHHGSGHRESRLSHCRITCCSCLHFAVPLCPDLWFPLWWSSIAWSRAPSTTSSCARTTLTRTTRLSIGSPPTPGHGTRALESLGRGSGGNAASLAQHDGKGPPAPHADASLPSRPGRGLTTWMAMVVTNKHPTLGSACIFRRSSPLSVRD